MSSTHLSLHVHIVFSTKNRFPFIADEWRDRLHAFIGGTVRTTGAVPLCIGGTNDHVHLLIGIRATHCLADILRDVKHASSEWVHESIGVKKFGWQDGYGAFTVGASQITAVSKYIRKQVEHHRKRTFEDEYTFLDRYGVEYDRNICGSRFRRAAGARVYETTAFRGLRSACPRLTSADPSGRKQLFAVALRLPTANIRRPFGSEHAIITANGPEYSSQNHGGGDRLA